MARISKRLLSNLPPRIVTIEGGIGSRSASKKYQELMKILFDEKDTNSVLLNIRDYLKNLHNSPFR